MIANIDKVVKVTKACVVLDNFLIKTNNAYSNGYCPANYIDTDGPSGERPGDWRREEYSSFALQPLNNAVPNNYSRNAKQIREDFTNQYPFHTGFTELAIRKYHTNNLKNVSDVF